MKFINDGKKELKQEDTKNSNKMLFILMGIIILAIIVVLVLLSFVQNQKKIEANTGILINGKKSSLGTEELFIKDGTVYYPIRNIAEALGYKTYNGEAKFQTEDTDKCYIINSNESVSFFENKDYIYFLDTTKNLSNQTYKEYQIDKPVIKDSKGNLCVSENGLMKACSVYINHEITSDNKIKKVEITTLATFIAQYTKIAQSNSFSIPENQSLENQKALLHGWIIVGDNSGKYGIIDGKGNELLGAKYNKIEYDEYTTSFKITDSQGKVGIWTIQNGEVNQKISNLYETITLIDKNKQFYLVSLNSKYGVVDFNGKVIVNIEYDGIGVDTSKFTVENPYLLYEQLIPVKKNNEWAILNLEGNQLAGGFSGLGCVADNKTTNAQNAILIPEYGLIVVAKNSQYGLVNWKGQMILECVLSNVYYSSSSGTSIAYMVSEGQSYDIVKYLDENGNGLIERYQKSNDIFSDF